jgi:hypothetical protein
MHICRIFLLSPQPVGQPAQKRLSVAKFVTRFSLSILVWTERLGEWREIQGRMLEKEMLHLKGDVKASINRTPFRGSIIEGDYPYMRWTTVDMDMSYTRVLHIKVAYRVPHKWRHAFYRSTFSLAVPNFAVRVSGVFAYVVASGDESWDY